MVMKFFRKKKNMKIILWAVAVLIIPGFLIWGVGIGGDSKKLYYAAVVNREPITLRDYYHTLSETEERYRQIFGENAGDIFKNMNIEQGVLENMIRERLLLQRAKRRRIRVLNNEIVEVIKAEPVFKDDKGKFDEQKFKEIISNYPSEELRKIEDEIRKNIMVEKLKEIVITEGNVTVSDKEVADYVKDHQITDKDEESIRRTLMWQKKEKFFNDWYSELRDNSNIKVYLSFDKNPPAEDKKIDGSKERNN